MTGSASSPFDGLPQGKNPPEGYLATANNRTMAPNYPYFIGGKFDFDYRIRRIRQLITTTPRHTLDSMAAMQMDSLSPAAQELVPLLLAKQPEPALAGWDFVMDREAPEPLIFTAWLRALAHVILDPRLGENFSDVWFWDAPLLIEALKGGPDAALCDNPKTPAVEDCAADIRLAHEQAIAGADRRLWCRPDPLALGRRPSRAFPQRLPVAYPAARRMVRPGAAGGRRQFHAEPRQPPGRRSDQRPLRRHPWRQPAMILDLADLDRSRFIIAGGQSGNPVSATIPTSSAVARRPISEYRRDGDNHLRLEPEVHHGRDPRRHPPAAAVLDGQIVRTPSVPARRLAEASGAAGVVLKLENLQYHRLVQGPRRAQQAARPGRRQAKASGVIAMSAGNHAQGVAYHAQRLGIPATIVMPRGTPFIKVERTRSFGARVMLEGDSIDAAAVFARELRRARGPHLRPSL